MYNKVKIFNQTFNSLNTYKAICIIDNFIKLKAGKVVCGKNVYLVVECSRNKFMHRFYESVDLVTVDGRPLVYVSRLFLKKPFSEMVGGPNLWSKMVEHISKNQYSLFILGGTQEAVSKAVDKLKKGYRNLIICGYRDGYLKKKEINQVINDIISIQPDVIFLGLPSPMKEDFAIRLKSKNVKSVVVLVGGMIDIFSGEKKLAPLWMSKLCIEWLYRLYQEPKRLYKRYLISNIKFFFLLIKEISLNTWSYNK